VSEEHPGNNNPEGWGFAFLAALLLAFGAIASYWEMKEQKDQGRQR